MPRRRGATFRSLGNRNFRLYFTGQLMSAAGTFMHLVAQAWLVLELTDSGVALGVVTTLQFLPALLLSGPAGVLIDRFDRRRLFLIAQVLGGAEAVVLGALTITGVVELWMVYVFAAALGTVNSLDVPVRAALVFDLVGPEDLANATGLHLALMNASRVVGPALAGVTIAAVGVGPCFLINAASFGAVIVAVAMMRPGELYTEPRRAHSPGQLREGLRYVRGHPEILGLLVMAAIFFGLAWEHEVVLPLVAQRLFDGDAGTFAMLTSALGAGSVVGGLVAANFATVTNRTVLHAAVVCGLASILAAGAPTLLSLTAALVVLGGCGTVLASSCSTRLQLLAAPEMRGRVVSLWVVAALGTRPVGGPFVGWVGEALGPRQALSVGAIGILALALPIWYLLSGRAIFARRVEAAPKAPVAVADVDSAAL